MHKHTERLLELKNQHNLKYHQIAEMTGVAGNTALIWLMKNSPRPIPFKRLYDLEVKLNGQFSPLD